MTKRIIQYIFSGICCLLTVAACLEEKDPLNYSPAVTTGGVTNIGYTNATLAGAIRQNINSVIADGGILISERSDLEAYTKLEVAASTFSSFSIEAVDLTPGTTYYYCTYANSGYSMVRGEIRNFTTQEGVAPVFGNVEITGHDEKSATLTASIADLGGSELVLCGVRYWEAENGEENVETAGTLATVTPDDNYTITISNLMPSTEYILCAVAQNTTGIGYGPKLHVTTDEAVLPVLSEIVPLDSTVVSIEVSAQVLDAGKSALKEVGFCWSMESQEPTPSHNHQNLPLPADGEAFTLNIENLTADQTYYIRAYAYNDEEEPGYSPVKIFRTTSSAPIVENAVAENIEYTTATLKARIASHGGLTITAKGFYYSDTNTNPGEGDMQVTATNAQADSIIASVDGLASHTTYYVRAFATNARGTSVSGEVYSFTTADNRTVPTVETAEATNIGSMTATFSGHIAADGNTPITARGFCYGTDPNPAQNGTRQPVEGNGNDFNWEAEGLSSSTTYYVCAYAENEMGAAYGEVVSFTTEDRVPGIYSLEELLAFRDAKNNNQDISEYKDADGVIRLYTDIDLSSVENWVTIQYLYPDETLDGNGHTINNIWMEEGDLNLSFISTNQGTIQDLTLQGVINASSNVTFTGAFCIINEGTIRNCHNYVDISGQGEELHCGGLANNNLGLIDNCTNHGNLTAAVTGGFVETCTITGTISNCTNYGNITATMDGGGIVGGINEGGLSNCTNIGIISVAGIGGGISARIQNGSINGCLNQNTVSGNTVGGIIGRIELGENAIEISNNTHGGNVESTSRYIGGICGDIMGQGELNYSNNANTGTVNGEPGTDDNAIGYDGRNQQ